MTREKARVRKKLKALKAQEGIRIFVVGKDVNIDRVDVLPKRALVGRIESTRVSRVKLIDCVNKTTLSFNYAPRINNKLYNLTEPDIVLVFWGVNFRSCFYLRFKKYVYW